jgi:hypothetical protein
MRVLPSVLVAALLTPPPPPPPSGGGGAPSQGDAPPRPAGPAASPSASPEGGSDPLPNDITGPRRPSEDVSASWNFSRGSELQPNFVDEGGGGGIVSINPIGFYGGVTLDGTNAPPFAVALGGDEGSTVLTWTGFERGPDSSRVFFQLSRAVEPEVHDDGLRIDIRLPNTRLNVKNNGRGLDTRFFQTPVLEVQLDAVRKRKGPKVKGKRRPSSADTHITVLLRAAVKPEIRMQPAANGYHMLVLEFPDAALSQGVVVESAQDDTPPPPPAAGQ